MPTTDPHKISISAPFGRGSQMITPKRTGGLSLIIISLGLKGRSKISGLHQSRIMLEPVVHQITKVMMTRRLLKRTILKKKMRIWPTTAIMSSHRLSCSEATLNRISCM